MDNEKERIMNKIKFFMEKHINVHIKLKTKRFLNAEIVEQISDEVFLIEERYNGLMHLFLPEVLDLEEYKVEKER